jgi:phosphocarrier protein
MTASGGGGRPRAEGAVLLAHAVGLHARPSVKLTKLAKSFGAAVRVRVGEAGAWIDAKSIVKVMALKAPEGAVLHIQAEGPDAAGAVASLVALVERDFADERPD